jgi:hypothetical protein
MLIIETDSDKGSGTRVSGCVYVFASRTVSPLADSGLEVDSAADRDGVATGEGNASGTEQDCCSLFPTDSEERDAGTAGVERLVVIATESVTGAVAAVEGLNGAMVIWAIFDDGGTTFSVTFSLDGDADGSVCWGSGARPRSSRL